MSFERDENTNESVTGRKFVEELPILLSMLSEEERGQVLSIVCHKAAHIMDVERSALYADGIKEYIADIAILAVIATKDVLEVNSSEEEAEKIEAAYELAFEALSTWIKGRNY